VTTTTHKTLRGPRGGLILTNDEVIAKKINSAIFPGIQGGPLMHVIAGKAVALHEALDPSYKLYIQRVLANARAMAQTFMDQGIRIVSGGTDNHLMLLDLRSTGLTGKEADAMLGALNYTVNKNTIPNDPQSPFVTSGLRIGTPALTTRGFQEEDCRRVAVAIAEVLKAPTSEAPKEAARKLAAELCERYPLYPAHAGKVS
jgi:glycine hydroxymethyltransferase